jgi:transcriptional regulator with XRE-family HTH domain
MMKVQAYLKQIGRNIRGARKRRGLKQSAVTSEIGINYRHYQNIEAGKINVTIDTLCRLAKLYKVELEELVRDVCL